MFGIADTLWHATGSYRYIPDEWEYRHGMGCDGVTNDDYPDIYIRQMYTRGTIDLNSLVYAGNVLNRYADWLRAAGKDY